MLIKKISVCFYQAMHNTINHDGIEHAGYIAFLAILSIFPFLVFIFAIVGFFGQTEIGIEITKLFFANQIIPKEFLAALKPRVDEIVSGPPQGLLTVAILGAIWTASSMFEAVRTVLNRAYQVITPPSYLLRRLLSILQFIIMTAIVILVTLVFILIPNLWNYFSDLPLLHDIKGLLVSFGIEFSSYWFYFRYVIVVLSLFFVVSCVYYTLPNIKQSWIDVLPGALIVVFLWFAVGYGFFIYLIDFPQVSIIYGSLAGFIAAMLFFFFSAMVLIFGAEFNYLLVKMLGHNINIKIEEKDFT